MPSGTLQWSEDEPDVNYLSGTELKRLLATLHLRFLDEKQPTMVLLTRESGDMLGIVLGLRDESALTYVASDNRPPYFESTGDSGRRGLFRYFSFNTWTDAPQSMLVPLTVATEAAVLFSDTGRLSSSIEWIEPGPRRH
jgi:hypothetical protein